MVCSSCGTGNPDSARFCMECGLPLGSVSAVPPPTQERRVVTVLFADLVGFTARSDRADPEDVRRTLVPFHAGVKADLERFGGTLDKFIGDAVMGVFGAPIAHDDDPARAVRAALRMLQTIEELRRGDPEVAVRIAVNTGEAIVSFGLGPQVGEAVAGDVVNTASRMQSLAPRGSVVVGELTMRAVRGDFELEGLPAATVKGKAEPLQVWRVVGASAGASADILPTTFVGRDGELGELLASFEQAVETSSTHLLRLLGDAGIGKSRLVAEFRERLGSKARWLIGRCLPYGEAVTFSPVVEMVRTVADISPTDDAPAALDKLREFARLHESHPGDREWLVSRLGSMLGDASGDDADPIPSTEIGRAWARLLALAAGDRPLVAQLDDLHWAEPALLELVGHVADALARRPMLLLCTARPELLERADAWAVGRTNTTSLRLAPLSAEETGRLLDTLLAQVAVPRTARASLVERAGGNPLYALEFARMLDERASTTDHGLTTMPESVQAVVAARLDAIPAELRSLVQDASVAGEAFWPVMLAWLRGRSARDVHTDVEELVRRGVAERADSSSLPSHPEYGFSHALLREVAYGRIPRGTRARRHCSVGTWIREQAGDRAEEWAETLARHFAMAVELAEAAGEPDVADVARAPAVRWLMAAGRRVGRLDALGAFALYDRAAELASPDGSARSDALAASAQMGRRSGEIDAREVLRRYEEVLAIARGRDDSLAIGAALTRLASQTGAMGDTARSRQLLSEAVGVLEGEPPGRDLARAYAYRAEEEMFAGHVRESVTFADRALELLQGEGDEELVVMALHIRGDARCSVGEPSGLADLREALRLAEASGNAADVATSQNYLSDWLCAMEGPAIGLATYEVALELAERRGLVTQKLWTLAASLSPLFDLGMWDRALESCHAILAVGPDRLDGSLVAAASLTHARIDSLRGSGEAADSAADLVELARRVQELHVLGPALVVAAEMAMGREDRRAASDYLHEFAEVTAGVAAEYRESQLSAVARTCAASGELALLDRLIAESTGVVRRGRLAEASARAIAVEAAGDPASAAEMYAEAAGAWRAFGNVFEELQALLGERRCRPSSDWRATDGGRRAEELIRVLGLAA